MATLSTYISAQTADYQLLNGKVVFANELATEAYSRIVTPLGTYIFDPTFGCEIPGWFNTRIKVSANQVVTAANNALQPMVTQGRALSVATTCNSITLNSVNFTCNIVDTNNNSFQFSVPYISGV
jgi:phage gp46-like protein